MRCWLEIVDGKPCFDLDFVLFYTLQQGLPVFLRELISPHGFNPVSLSFIMRDVFTVSYRLSLTTISSQLWVFISLRRNYYLNRLEYSEYDLV